MNTSLFDEALEACTDIFKPAECTNPFAACGYGTGVYSKVDTFVTAPFPSRRPRPRASS
jgi:hypothetical protein